MKLATLGSGRPDGQLVVVSSDLTRCVSAGRIAPSLQAALDDWTQTAPALSDLSARLEAGEIALKGKSRPDKLFALIGDESLAETTQWKTLLVRHAHLLDAIRTGRRANFAGLKRDCLAIAPPGLEDFYDHLTGRAKALKAAE